MRDRRYELASKFQKKHALMFKETHSLRMVSARKCGIATQLDNCLFTKNGCLCSWTCVADLGMSAEPLRAMLNDVKEDGNIAEQVHGGVSNSMMPSHTAAL